MGRKFCLLLVFTITFFLAKVTLRICKLTLLHIHNQDQRFKVNKSSISYKPSAFWL
ncbi:hypothetical protein AALP_AA8G258100 [Arabis alpina]|uniref:Uncharacterized protein n=1 Tax=Arabis alpina TaxID=50452 RepID=A0A087G9F5_ARAAL|nr:hypothetical protein AALP_AA8G258100 [Arabis alpina]